MRTALVLALVAGCHKDEPIEPGPEPVDLAGLYRVYAHTLSHTDDPDLPVDCDAGGKPEAFPSHVSFEGSTGIGFTLAFCRRHLSSSCESTSWTFNQGSPDGWSAEVAAVRSAGGLCELSLVRTEAVMLDDSHVQVLLQEWAQQTRSGLCVVERAEALADSDRCVHRERLEAEFSSFL